MATRVAKSKGPLPFALVELAVNSYVIAGSEGTYEVTVQVISLADPEKESFTVVPFVNGVQQPGAEMLSGDRLYTFRAVKPEENKDVVLGLAEIADLSNRIELTINASKFQKPAVVAAVTALKELLVTASYRAPDGNHQVRILLLDENGKSRNGQVEILAGQNFELNGAMCDGSTIIEVNDDKGVSVKIKPLSFDEGFLFTDLDTRLFVKKTLLAKK